MNIDTDCCVCGEAVFEGQRAFGKVLWDRTGYSVLAWRHLNYAKCWNMYLEQAAKAGYGDMPGLLKRRVAHGSLLGGSRAVSC